MIRGDPSGHLALLAKVGNRLGQAWALNDLGVVQH